MHDQPGNESCRAWTDRLRRARLKRYGVDPVQGVGDGGDMGMRPKVHTRELAELEDAEVDLSRRQAFHRTLGQRLHRDAGERGALRAHLPDRQAHYRQRDGPEQGGDNPTRHHPAGISATAGPRSCCSLQVAPRTAPKSTHAINAAAGARGPSEYIMTVACMTSAG